MAAIGEVGITIIETSFEEEKQDDSLSKVAWRIFGQAVAFSDKLGNFNLFGIVTVNWREIPCVLGLALAVMNIAYSLLLLSTPPMATVLLAMVSGCGIYYIRDSMNLRSLSSQITQLEAIRIKYENQGKVVEANLKELLDLEVRLIQIKSALEQTTRLLGDREAEYKALNEAHLQLYLKYEALLLRINAPSSMG